MNSRFYKTAHVHGMDAVPLEYAIDKAIHLVLAELSQNTGMKLRLVSAAPFSRDSQVIFVTVIAEQEVEATA